MDVQFSSVQEENKKGRKSDDLNTKRNKKQIEKEIPHERGNVCPFKKRKCLPLYKNHQKKRGSVGLDDKTLRNTTGKGGTGQSSKVL